MKKWRKRTSALFYAEKITRTAHLKIHFRKILSVIGFSRVSRRIVAFSPLFDECKMQFASLPSLPTLPRNWCKDESPNLSAFKIKISVAFVSMPTSITLVAIKVWFSAWKIFHSLCFSSVLSFPWITQVGKSSNRLPKSRKKLSIESKSLPSASTIDGQTINACLPSLSLFAINSTAACKSEYKLVYVGLRVLSFRFSKLQYPRKSQRHRARNWCCRQTQHVARPLLFELCSVVYAESMLFVNDGKRKILIFDVVGYKRICADNALIIAVFNPARIFFRSDWHTELVSNAYRMPDSFAIEPNFFACCSASISVGAISAACFPPFAANHNAKTQPQSCRFQRHRL